MTVSAMNFKPFESGALRGFFDLRYHGMTVKGCRLMAGSNGLWVSFPQKEAEQDGERRFFDLMFLTPPEAEHVRRQVVADLQAQGHIDRPAAKQRGKRLTPEGEDVSQYYSNPADDDGDIPF